MDLTHYDALSFDCYGTLIDWEAGLTGVLGPWARRQQLRLSDEEVLVAYSGHEAEVEAERPNLLYPRRAVGVPASYGDGPRGHGLG